ncbi:MAG: glutathione S-transferase family protein [Rhodocyclaceae bacterium]|nr:glutathione S-transferase family protein [Rhodocyclaceae bacterium]
MKLYVSERAPNPRRVQMFIAEKGMTGIEQVRVSIGADEHKRPEFVDKNPMARLPVLELDDGRFLSETRAICTYLEGVLPEPNLMGDGYEERAFVEMADRRIEWYLFLGVTNWVRHTHPGLAPLEQPQFKDFGNSQGRKVREVARWLDGELARHEFVAGNRFTIADITAFCCVEFSRGLMKFSPAKEGMPNLQAWRDRIAERPSAVVS